MDTEREEGAREEIRASLDETDNDLVEKTDEAFRNIKMMIMVTLIFEITRTRPDSEKRIIRNYF